jgi:hypothetical protein
MEFAKKKTMKSLSLSSSFMECTKKEEKNDDALPIP